MYYDVRILLVTYFLRQQFEILLIYSVKFPLLPLFSQYLNNYKYLFALTISIHCNKRKSILYVMKHHLYRLSFRYTTRNRGSTWILHCKSSSAIAINFLNIIIFWFRSYAILVSTEDESVKITDIFLFIDLNCISCSMFILKKNYQK